MVKRFTEKNKRKNEYALVELQFMKSNNLDEQLISEVNSRRILKDAREVREYFGIEFSKNMGNIMGQFCNNLGKFIP